jgi:hypothetical protein
MKLGTANPCHANALRHVRGLRATLPELFQCGGQNRAVCDVPPYFWLCRQLSRCVFTKTINSQRSSLTYNGRHAFTLSIARKRSAVPSFS